MMRHVQSNQLILGCWVFLLLIITYNFGKVFGIPYLFFDPEYLGEVGFMSFLIVGASFGGLMIAFHITSYVLYGAKYSFIGILEKPFSKFSINNSPIPLIVLVVYLTQVIRFQIQNEYSSSIEIIWMLIGLLLGIVFTFFLFYAYFWFTNKDIFQYLAGAVDKQLKKSKINRKKALNKLKESKKEHALVTGYFDLKLSYRNTQNLHYFYDKEAVIKVFDQNHFNSVVIEFLIVGLILLLRYFMDSPYFQIPAAASIILLLTMALMLAGAVSYWFRGWGVAVAIIGFLFLNTLMKIGVLNAVYKVPGLDYSAHSLPYSVATIKKANNPQDIQRDIERTIVTLENWKSKQQDSIPKMVLLCVSGGGQRAALWTFNALYRIDSALDGQLMRQSALITGASGGAVGAAYYREMSLRKSKNKEHKYFLNQCNDNISKDILNPIIFSLLVNDLAFRNQYYNYEGQEYLKDRGYAFERQLNKNTDYILDKKLTDYRAVERNADIPMMILAPTIALDGSRLYISPDPVRYMNNNLIEAESKGKHSGIDFLSFFDSRESENLKFLTAVRMNASFPYVTPNLQLPTNPPIETMDAGISDNYGISDALKFLFTFNEWIANNTSGVVILSIRDTKKMNDIEGMKYMSIIEKFSAPVSSVYNNLGNAQDINNDYKIAFAKNWFSKPIDVVEIEYNTNSIFTESTFMNKRQELKVKGIERASLSWHLTQKEKNNIIQNFDNPECQSAIMKLKKLLEVE